MELKVMTFNIQSTRDFVKRNFNPYLMADVIKKNEAVIIGLNEVRGDGPDEFYVDQTKIIAESLGFKYYFFGPAIYVPSGGPYGNALISKFPIVSSKIIPILDPIKKDECCYYESRAIIVSQIDVLGKIINVVVTHMGLARGEQINAVEEVTKIITTIDGPTILMGDFNMKPNDELIKRIGSIINDTSNLVKEPLLTFPSIKPNRKIDYIFTKNIDVITASIPNIVASDHFPYVCKIRID